MVCIVCCCQDRVTDTRLGWLCRALYHLAATARFWLDIMLVMILALLPHFFAQAMKVRFWPSDVEIVRGVEKQKQGRHVETPERPGVELSEVPGA